MPSNFPNFWPGQTVSPAELSPVTGDYGGTQNNDGGMKGAKWQVKASARACHNLITSHKRANGPRKLLGILYEIFKARCFSLCLLFPASFLPLLHSQKQSTPKYLFWCFRLSQIEDTSQYLEGQNSTWKNHDRNIGVQIDKRWSFQILIRVIYL